MLPVHFPEENFTFNKPVDMTDEECMPLPVCKCHDPTGLPMIISCWEMTEEELEFINRTRKIYVGIIGEGQPPFFVEGKPPFISGQN